MQMSEQIRSFIAFDINNEAILTKLTAAQKLLVETGADLKMVAPQKIHITIRFLGNVSPSMVEKVFDAMKKVEFKPFTVQLCGLGVFPSLNYPRVVWAAMTVGAEQLKSVASQLEPHIKALGFPKDAYGFSPHLTIARVRSGKNKQLLAEFVTKKATYDFGTINADCLRLKRSELSPKGPTYSTLKEYCPSP
jgi:RNA 2',3'-cyclic 3'-phosphodiesterase